jgi:hypothetical protein
MEEIIQENFPRLERHQLSDSNSSWNAWVSE